MLPGTERFEAPKKSLFFHPTFHTLFRIKAPVAQRIEQRFPKPLAAGSTPAWGTIAVDSHSWNTDSTRPNGAGAVVMTCLIVQGRRE